jgi:hypothetical protein
LKAGLCVRRARRVIVTPDRRHSRRSQAGFPLIELSEFARPPLSSTETAENKALVQVSFDRWQAGTGSPFELLASDADWTIVGSSPLSKTYSRQAFLDEVIHPFNARMATPLVPTCVVSTAMVTW